MSVPGEALQGRTCPPGAPARLVAIILFESDRRLVVSLSVSGAEQ